MGKNKLSKFADMKTYPNVFEYAIRYGDGQTCEMQGHWNESFFHNNHPIVLELGCGRGEYTIGLARQCSGKNYIGIDIKGARMWSGATEALREGLTNVAFLRTGIEQIHRFFAPGEVSELWITFPDPQMKKHTKRLTSTPFLERYSQILRPDGIIHLKTDSPFLYTYTDALVKLNDLPVEVNTANLYGPLSPAEEEKTSEARLIQTYYETHWLGRGLDIKYIRFRLPPGKELHEPEIEIELDSYRSYNRTGRSGIDRRAAAK